MIDSNAVISHLKHHLLVATERLNETPFAQSVIYVCQHDALEGSMGVRINKPVEDVNFTDLVHNMGLEDMLLANAERRPTLLEGGPLDTNKGIVLHSSDYTLKNTASIGLGVSLSATQQVVQDIARGMGPRHVTFCLGYAGWSVGQLEHEIAENDWLVMPAETSLVFQTPYAERYDFCMKHMGLTFLNFSVSDSAPVGLA